MGNPGQTMPPQQPQQQALYDQPNCDYEPPKNFQNFGNPYDCPENMYGGSMMSSVGYSQVENYTQNPQLLPGQQIQMQHQQQMLMQQLQQQQQQQQPHQVHLPAGAQPLPGMAALPPPPPASGNVQDMVAGDTGTVIYKGGPSNAAVVPGGRGPLPMPNNGGGGDNSSDDASFPPPPPSRGGGGGANSADNSLNDSNSTTQSNVTSECSEAECDREVFSKKND